ncbi:MAG: glycoside hydrolase family 38 C-terminal domain-containing protein [Candidatus Thorarchaeota archaeon]
MVTKKAIIVPHTHWDREWYLPFQRFRYMLVHLVDELLEIMKEQDFVFMLDGQTVVIEDYLEIRPEKKEELLQRIRQGKIAVGPWYLLPDEWLVGGESLIRNLEYSQELARDLDIPTMNIGYLPDQFGHTSAIPQLLSDMTNLKSVVLWRGVPPAINEVPFIWKSHEASQGSVRGVYLPGGYGNASRFPVEYDGFTQMVDEKIAELEPFSPIPIYLLMNGSDHLFPQPFIWDFVKKTAKGDLDISVALLKDYIESLESAIEESHYETPVYIGEFRSPARAPLLQDTYSARMWIKQWNQRIEDLLTRRVEPIWTYLSSVCDFQYPSGFLKIAWKWLLRNHPHDSICGCSVDQTHDEMETRFSWAESIGESALSDAVKTIQKSAETSEESSVIVFNAGGSSKSPVYIEFTYPRKTTVKGLRADDGILYDVQPLKSKDDIFLETTVGMTTAKMGMKLIPGRKLMDFYINGVEYFDGDEPGLLELRLIADKHPIGDFDMEDLKRQANEVIGSNKYKKVHLVAARPSQQVYAAVVPLRPWAFSRLVPVEEIPDSLTQTKLVVGESSVSNEFYSASFNKDGSLAITNSSSGMLYQRLHVFEDYGDRGDEYTFGRVGPEKARVKDVRRTIVSAGPIVSEIRQTLKLEVFGSVDDSREKRIGKVEIPVDSVFKFYRDTPRIDVATRLTNLSKDHRLRVCFDLPFKSDNTLTATHFGCIQRSGDAEKIPDAEELEKTKSSYPEMPSGIQPQKGFIRVEDKISSEAFTIVNMGLPEVELVDSNRIALTLLRCIGWLSRSDFPERPMDAGPSEETPGAQELDKEYEFNYGFLLHSKEDSLSVSAEQSDVFSSTPEVVTLESATFQPNLYQPLIELDSQEVRISSMRKKGNSILVTLYNLANTNIETNVQLMESIKTVSEIRLDGTVAKKHKISTPTVKLMFNPREIKLCCFSS